jgi:hypothetical protein
MHVVSKENEGQVDFFVFDLQGTLSSIINEAEKPL